MAYPFPFVAGNILTAAELNALATVGQTPLGFTSGAYYSGNFVTSSNAVQTEQLVHYSPFYVPSAQTFDRIAIASAAGGAGTNNIRLGIYNNDTATAKPSTVNLDAGTVAVNLPGTIFTITISATLSAGWYWLAFCPQGGGGTRNFQQVASAISYGNYPFRQIDALTGQNSGYQQAGVSGAFATAVPTIGATAVQLVMPKLRAL